MKQPTHRLYTLGAPPSLWGDYGDILVHGMTEQAPDGTTLVMRTGPFVPPISQPAFSVIVTETVRSAMESQNFTGFEFSRVSKRRIVRVEWREWNLDADEPAEIPESGEPEDYILHGTHSAATAREMEELWELKMPPIPGLQISGGSNYDLAKYSGQDICKMQRLGGYVYVSQRLRDWLDANYSEWVRFQPASPATAA